jgi:hypothetical protein
VPPAPISKASDLRSIGLLTAMLSATSWSIDLPVGSQYSLPLPLLGSTGPAVKIPP